MFELSGDGQAGCLRKDALHGGRERVDAFAEPDVEGIAGMGVWA